MNELKLAMKNYFPKLLHSYNKMGYECPFTVASEDAKNVLLISKHDTEGWYNWLPVEKTETTDFTALETKYFHKLHQDIKDYYNQYWFYDISGEVYIDDNMLFKMVELERVVPGRELLDLDSHIERYYRGGNIFNFRMVPIGYANSLFVVVDNVTGEVFVDDRLEFGVFRKIADNLAELINKLSL